MISKFTRRFSTVEMPWASAPTMPPARTMSNSCMAHPLERREDKREHSQVGVGHAGPIRFTHHTDLIGGAERRVTLALEQDPILPVEREVRFTVGVVVLDLHP